MELEGSRSRLAGTSRGLVLHELLFPRARKKKLWCRKRWPNGSSGPARLGPDEARLIKGTVR